MQWAVEAPEAHWAEHDARRDVHAAVVFDVDLHAGSLNNGSDHLAAGSDDVADLLGRDADRDDARRVLRDVTARGRDGFVHHVEDLEPALLGLRERLARDVHGSCDGGP
jgi:hypothetical protein